MATITIRGLDESVKSKLRIRAAQHGRSMEAEAREILRSNLLTTPDKELGLATSVRRRVEKFGGVELKIAPRDPIREPPDFAK
jgi:antitoxin FitA